MRLNPLLLSLFILITLPIKSGAQVPAHRLFTVFDGLAQQQVASLFKDSRGYLWVGTKGGVSRFDGVQFYNITRKDGLPDDHILNIDEDSRGDIWFHCRSGISRFDGSKLTTFYFPMSWSLADYISSRDDSNRLWFKRHREPYIVFFDKDSFDVAGDFEGSNTLYVHQGQAFLTGKNIGTLVWQSNRFQPVNHLPKKIRPILANSQLDGDLVVYSDSPGLYNYYLLKSGEEHFLYRRARLAGVDYIDSLDLSRLNQDLYVPFPDTLYHFDAQLKQADKILLPVKCNAHISLVDQSGLIWLGTEEGLLQVFPKGIINYSQPEMKGRWAVLEDEKGILWFPSHKQGLTCIKGDSVWVEKRYHSITQRLIFKDAFYFGAKSDRRGNLYFPMEEGVLMKQRNRWTLLQAPRSVTEMLAINLEMDTIRQLLITGTRGGINIFKDGKFVRYVGEAEGVHPNYCIVYIDVDSCGDYWLGSFKGFSCYNPDSHHVKNYQLPSYNDEKEAAITMHRDTEGVLWIGGKFSLMRYDATLDSVFQVLLFEDLDYIMSMQETDNEKLLIAHSRGLIWLDLATYRSTGDVQYYSMNQYNGYLGISPNQSAIYKDQKGDIWVPSSTIMTRFSPEEMTFSNQTLRPIVESVNNELLPFCYLSEDSVYTISNPDISLKLNAIGYNRPTNASYRYLLEGRSTGWSDWSEEDVVSFRGLKSGAYRFLFQTRQASNILSEKPSLFVIQVKLPFTKEPYFPAVIFSSLAIILIITLFSAWLNYRWGKAKAVLSEALRVSNEEVQTQFKEIKTLKEEQSHRFSNDLILISSWVDIAQYNTSEPKAQEALQEMAKFVGSVKSINRLLEPYPKAQVSLEDFLGKLGNLLLSQPLSGNRTIQFQLDAPPVISSRQARYLGLLSYELIVNSIKHAFSNQTKPSIQIKVHQEADILHFRYHDNGSGIAPNSLPSQGSKLIESMCLQLGTQFSSYFENGQVYIIRFPLD